MNVLALFQAVYIRKKTQENRWGIEECIRENNEKRGVKEDCQLRMRNLSQESNKLSIGDVYNIPNKNFQKNRKNS
jgi:hypothetical protein